MTETISLGGTEFKVFQIINLKESLTVPKHKVEDGYSISEHAQTEPAEFTVELELLKNSDEPETLNSLFDAKEPLTFISELGVFDDMEIQDKNYTQGGNISTVKASVHLKQILKATAKTTTIELPITIAKTEVKGGATPTEPETKKNEAAKSETKEEDKTWLETIGGWFS